MGRTVGRLAAIASLLIAQATFAAAAEIKVYSTIGVKSALEELAPKFEQATGNKLAISWGLISSFTKKAQDGDVPDVLIVSRASIDGLTKDGKIAAAIKPKSKFPPPAGFVGTLLVSGDVDLAFQSKPELTTTEGVDIVGPPPGDLGHSNVFAAGVGAASKNGDAGKALLKFLTSPEAQAVFKAKGFDPA
jgi:ABC-type molybdate transport system substrate-binding protein